MLQIDNLQKNFGAVKALSDASLKVETGEIRALLGANGSGKSTLVKVLSGLNRKDGGTIRMDGREIDISSPAASRKCRIAMAYQDLSLIPELSIEENLVLGKEPGRGMLQRKAVRAYACEMIDALGIQGRPEVQVGSLDLSNQALVEVAKALYIDPMLLLLDEITASMHHDQVQRLFDYLRRKRENGLSILFVSHRFEEVYAFCETATILRGGFSVQDVLLEDTAPDRLVYYMTGREIKPEQLHEENNKAAEGKVVLEVEHLSTGGQVHDISMTIREGDIIGIAGLQGQGQSEFLRALYGACAYHSGKLVMDGSEIKNRSPKDAVRRGIGFISGDREKEQILSVRSVAENLLMVEHAMRPLCSFRAVKTTRKKAEKLIKKLQVVAAGSDAPANSLSGGNQQKLAVGRWLDKRPRILLLDDPTKGVDVAARNEINGLFRNMTQNGTAIVYSSSDNEELLELVDRIYVFYEGRIIKELTGSELNEDALACAMLGVSEGGAKE